MHYYKVIADAWMYGKHYKAGEYIKLNAKQAKYEILSGTIDPIAAPDPKPAIVKPAKPNLKAKEL